VRLLLNSTGEGIYGVDAEGRCTFANPACARLLGYDTPDELLGHQMHELVHHTRPDGTPYPVTECRIYQAFRDHQECHVDDELMFRADGTSFEAEYWSHPVVRDGELVGCVVTFIDITERLHTRRKLAEYARFPEMNPGPVLRLDRDGQVLAANTAAVEICGDDLIGRTWQSICGDLDETRWTAILEADHPTSFELAIGDREFVFTHRSDPDGDALFVFGTDITERRAAEHALREKEEFVRLLLNSTGEGIYGVDLEGHCTFANPACAHLLGFDDVSQLMGRQMHELVHHTRPNGTPYPVTECRIYRAFREGRGTHVDDEVMFRADQSSFPAEYWSYPVRSGGELVGCVVTFVDITERRQVEEELRQTEKMAALGKLSAGLAHELNNPAAAAARAAEQLRTSLVHLTDATVDLAAAGMSADDWRTIATLASELKERA
ncbi:MAG: PAS domain S-box protein, partial [Acidimicrobiia bacterium]|nr:PAS domain S-box protein [Acidimicrobiia bacterium]